MLMFGGHTDTNKLIIASLCIRVWFVLSWILDRKLENGAGECMFVAQRQLWLCSRYIIYRWSTSPSLHLSSSLIIKSHCPQVILSHSHPLSSIPISLKNPPWSFTHLCALFHYMPLSLFIPHCFCESVFLTQVETKRKMVYAGLGSDPSMNSQVNCHFCVFQFKRGGCPTLFTSINHALSLVIPLKWQVSQHWSNSLKRRAVKANLH